MKDIDFKIPDGWRKPKTSYIDPHWASLLSNMLKDRVDEKDRPRHQMLIDRLLSLGGSGVAILLEEDLEKLLTRGMACKGTKARLQKMRDCRCHQNAADLWRSNKERYRVATGWALSPDGCWRQHSWVVEPLVNWDNSGYQIVETTVRRVAYYGFMLTEEECQKFYYNQT